MSTLIIPDTIRDAMRRAAKVQQDTAASDRMAMEEEAFVRTGPDPSDSLWTEAEAACVAANISFVDAKAQVLGEMANELT